MGQTCTFAPIAGRCGDSALIQRRVCRTPLILVASPGTQLSDPDEILAQGFLAFGSEAGLTDWTLHTEERTDFILNSRPRVTSTDVVALLAARRGASGRATHSGSCGARSAGRGAFDACLAAMAGRGCGGHTAFTTAPCDESGPAPRGRYHRCCREGAHTRGSNRGRGGSGIAPGRCYNAVARPP